MSHVLNQYFLKGCLIILTYVFHGEDVVFTIECPFLGCGHFKRQGALCILNDHPIGTATDHFGSLNPVRKLRISFNLLESDIHNIG